MNWRDRFPVCERYAYLNAGTFGPLSRATLDAMADVRAREGEHGRAGGTYFDELFERRERVRMLLAAQIGVPAEHLALTESTTQGVHIAVLGLGVGPGDEVVTTDAEHIGLIGPLVTAGAKLRFARVDGLRAVDVFEAIRSELTSRTRLIALSAVSWIDGTIFPWRELREATGLPVLVDGAQSAGAMDVDATAADWFTVSAQKWLCGPDAMGAFYVRDPDALTPRLISGIGAASYDLKAGAWDPKPGAARFDTGFTPFVSLAGLEAALVDLPDGRFTRSRELTAQLRELLTEAGEGVVTQSDQATLVSWRARGDAAETVRQLFAEGVLLRDLPKTGLVRASVGWWNDESDLQRLVDALRN
ncbi:MAG TPA: aminotransferase class V-fold PLP-dependent enzyme [Gaiellaceae bacterium]